MKVRKKFEELKLQKKAAFIPFIMVGDPNLDLTEALIRIFVEEGADIIELGVPFSDPVADGKTIQRAAERALKHGISLQSVLDLVYRLRQDGLQIPILLFTYFNPILRKVFTHLF